MAYVPAASAEPGAAIEIAVRGQCVPACITPLPFYKRKS
jgi:glycine cleavage system aminomethyltransferase T